MFCKILLLLSLFLLYIFTYTPSKASSIYFFVIKYKHNHNNMNMCPVHNNRNYYCYIYYYSYLFNFWWIRFGWPMHFRFAVDLHLHSFKGHLCNVELYYILWLSYVYNKVKHEAHFPTSDLLIRIWMHVGCNDE